MSSADYFAPIISSICASKTSSLKERKEEGRRNTNPPDDKVWRCGVTLNQQLMSETSKPHTQASNNPRSLVQSWTAAKVEETKDWHADKKSSNSHTDLFIEEKGWGFSEEGRKSTKKLFNEASCQCNKGSEDISAADVPPYLIKSPECVSDLQRIDTAWLEIAPHRFHQDAQRPGVKDATSEADCENKGGCFCLKTEKARWLSQRQQMQKGRESCFGSAN